MNTSPWSPYRPADAEPWNLERAWTLRRRAGFAATWAELERDLADGPEKAVDRVLDGSCRLAGVPSDFARTAELLGDAAAGSSDARRLQAWWLFRCLFTHDPLQERLTLAWHDHFATSQVKVDDVGAMHRQNETFRKLGRGPFGDLLRALLHDPALLAWLDAPSNRKQKPNENLARELMELFTLGVGRYSESDVKEAARALTGLGVTQGRFTMRADRHDDGPKTVLGKTGNLDPDALADLLLAQPATADRLAWRLCNTFLGENVADAATRTALAEQLRGDGLHVGRAVDTILRSRIFFGPRNLHARIGDPVGFVVGSVRALECFAPRPPSTLLLAEWTERLGQALFFPPNVGGWPGGRGWLSGRGVVARANFAAALAEGRLHADGKPPDFASLAERNVKTREPDAALKLVSEVLSGRVLDPSSADAIQRSAGDAGSANDRLNRAVALLLARPESQLV
ncbi:DUF1800 domain-containing protein [Paludisphaera borealis]|uniref:DUF1800 domain-containing protein n=1 Tax=Paludisphaera borealis TaxID=1387353 RepID=A0A1U7CXN3_9BACT|nr:DUF1800 domain-containing protein [Paludisphaera borealis]APW63707.1 hypothetical protein BSF38_05281 [Paludisphaera borealis]